MKRITSAMAVKAICMLCLISIVSNGGHVSASDHQLQSLFTPDSVGVGNAVNEKEEDPTIIRSRLVHVNFRLLSKDDKAPRTMSDVSSFLTLNLFEDVVFTTILDRFELNRSGSYTWIGHIDGIEQSQVTLVIKGDIMSGNITLPDDFYQVRYKGDGLHAIYRIDQSAFPDENEPAPVDTSYERPPPDTVMRDDGSIIDVMTVYTGAARAAVGGTSAMETLIDLAVSETNTGYSNSNVTQRVNLVHTAEVTYDESSFNWSTTLNRLRLTADGYMDNVHTLRDTYSADEIVLIVNNTDSCGLGYMMSSVSSSFASWAFSLVARTCATGYYSFAHEMGHNMGARHDWYVDDTTNSPYSYNHGYVAPAKNWRTIMAYGNDCSSCTRRNYWSNPAVSYGGVPMGVAQGTSTSCREGQSTPNCDADNHKTLNNTAYTVANFRTSNDYFYVDPSASCAGNTPCYTTIQTAINAASTGTTIKILQGSYSENVSLSTSKQVTLSGGWNSSYASQSSTTSVNSLTISNGCITVDNLVLETASAQMPPTVTTGSATSVTSSSATLNGTVNPNGSSTTYYFQYGTSTSYGSSTTSTSAGSGTSDVSVDASISGRSSNTTYHYRLVATNSAGTSYGDDQSFTTDTSPEQIASSVFGNDLGCGSSSFTATLTIDGKALTSVSGVWSDCEEFDCGVSLNWSLYANAGSCGIIAAEGSITMTCDCLYKYILTLSGGNPALGYIKTCPGDCSDVSSAFTGSMQLLDSVVLTKDADLLGLTVFDPLISE